MHFSWEAAHVLELHKKRGSLLDNEEGGIFGVWSGVGAAVPCSSTSPSCNAPKSTCFESTTQSLPGKT